VGKLVKHGWKEREATKSYRINVLKTFFSIVLVHSNSKRCGAIQHACRIDPQLQTLSALVCNTASSSFRRKAVNGGKVSLAV
jgi:hypothetical protein